MAYRGKFSNFKNPKKYVGDINNVTYRSLWERNVMMWLDDNPDVVEWSSEELYFHYEHPVEMRKAKYFPDFYVRLKNGKRIVIEVKPEKQTIKPKEPKRKTSKYMDEVTTWMVNKQKWKTASYYCDKSNMSFQIWTEVTLDKMGILNMKGIKPLHEHGKAKPKMKPLIKSSRKRTTPKRRS